jgi:anti-sigma28 factor (negative regulator of flagellin synthesis)
MDASRKMKMQALKDQLERDEYEIDTHKVADAIVQRLLASVLEATPPRG